MNVDEMAKIVAEWAIKKRQIIMIHFFGSRIKGTNMKDSDLDIAITLISDLDESGGLATWMHVDDTWRKELQNLLPCKVQIEWNDGKKTKIIEKGLSEASLLVYEKKI